MTIQLGGQAFTEDQVIAAIAASNDADHNHVVSPYSSLDEVSSVLQAVLHRLAALEDRLPIAHQGFGVVSTTSNNITTHRVQVLDQQGRTVIITFEVPTT